MSNQQKKISPELQPLEIVELDQACGGFLDRNYLRSKHKQMATYKNKNKN